LLQKNLMTAKDCIITFCGHNFFFMRLAKKSDIMSRSFMDLEDGDLCFTMSDNMAMDSDGHVLMRMGDNMAMDMDFGDLHMISSWEDEEEDD